MSLAGGRPFFSGGWPAGSSSALPVGSASAWLRPPSSTPKTSGTSPPREIRRRAHGVLGHAKPLCRREDRRPETADWCYRDATSPAGTVHTGHEAREVRQ